MAALLCVRQRGSQLAHAIRRAKLSRRKKWAVRGQRACTRAPPMGYYFASRISIQRLPPGAAGAIDSPKGSQRHCCAAQIAAAGPHGSAAISARTLPSSTSSPPQRGCPQFSRGSYTCAYGMCSQQRRHADAAAAGGRCTLMEGGHAHLFAYACTRRCAVCAVRAALQ